MSTSCNSDARALEVFDRWYTAHEGRDASGLADALADQVTIYSQFRRDPVCGRTAAIAHFLGMSSTFSDLSMALACAPATSEGRVLVEVTFSGAFTGALTWGEITTSGAGQRFRVPGVAVIRTRRDTVLSVRTFFDRDDWLQQIGVPAGR